MICRASAGRALVALAFAVFVFGGWTSAPSAVSAQTPVANQSITLSVEPMLGGKFEVGSWAAFRVALENSGPAVDGELRVAKPTQSGSTFSQPVQLATGARQAHVLYGPMAPLANRFVVSFVSAGSVVSSANVVLEPHNSTQPGVFVVSERPDTLVGVLNGVLGAGVGSAPEIVTLVPEQLPERAEAWSAVDLLVWHDVDANRLTARHVEAVRTWLALGGDLVVIGGSTGASTLASFPSDLLPYQPAAVVDVPLTDLQAILGTLPPDATTLPALTGSLERGVALASTGSSVIAARMPTGQGSTTLIGLDPSAPWIAASAPGNAFWSRVFESSPDAMNGIIPSDESFIANALGGLPSVQVPPFELLALLLIAYVVAIGPINYLVLRRRDRREWAWLTMPATILAFAVGAYGLGVFLKGGEVVINQLGVVHSSTGTDRGMAQVYVGVFSPSRATFDVTVGGDAVLAPVAARADPWVDTPSEGEDRPVDVVFGDPATVRGYSVGFGSLRAFRAQAAVTVPRIDSDLRLTGERLEGTIANASGESVSNVAVVYGNAVARVGDIGPGESRSVTLETSRGANQFGPALWERVLPTDAGFDSASVRSLAARRALVQHLTGGWESEFGMGFPVRTTQSRALGSGPVILAWRSGTALEVQVDGPAEQVGEQLYVFAARTQVSGPAVFSGGLVQHAVVDADNIEMWEEGDVFFLSRGTLSVDYWPLAFDGTFRASSLTLAMGRSQTVNPAARGDPLVPLPPEQQPDPDQPLATNPERDDATDGLPRLQLFDQVAGTWIEFEPLEASRSYTVVDPARYVDSAGRLRARFVVRSFDDFAEFALGVRLEGTIE